ncbi:MAG: thioredoxin-like domain-containing protein [Bacteroidota bacterium]
MRYLAIVLVLAGLFGDAALAQTRTSVIEGRVVGWDGEPMAIAVVEAAFSNRRVVSSRTADSRLEVEADGRYQLEVDRLGYVSLQFSGALHRRNTKTLFLMEADTIRLDVQLAPLILDPDQSYTRITTGDTDFDYEQGAMLEQVSPTQYTALVPAPFDEVVLEMPGMTVQRLTSTRNVLQSMNVDRFRYQGDGAFRYAADAPADSFTLRIDAALVPADSATEVQFTYGTGNRWHEQFATFYDDATTWMPADYRTRFRTSAQRRRGPNPSPEERMWERRVAVQDQAFRALRTEEPVARTFAMLRTLVEIGGFQTIYGRIDMPEQPGLLSADFKRALREHIPPTSLYWNIAPTLLRVFIADSPQEHAGYLDAFLADHPTPSTRRDVLHGLTMAAYRWEGTSPRTVALAERLVNEYPETDQAEEVGGVLGDAYGLDIGDGFVQLRTGIAFQEGLDEWPNMDSSTVLLDFYNLDCATCRDDLATLDTLYAEFQGEGFEIMSFALERDLERLYQFVAENARPWRRYALRQGFLDPVARTYRVKAVPYRVLYHGGQIVAFGEPLRGAALEARIRSLLDPDASP